MFQSNEEIFYTLILGSVLFVFLSFVVLVALLRYKEKQRLHIQEIKEIKTQYQKEVLKVELEVKEHTLNFISQEIHDNIGQILSLVKLNLNTVKIDNRGSSDLKIEEIKLLVGKAIQDLRVLSKTLNTDHILQKNLPESIELELDKIAKTDQFKTGFKITGKEWQLEPQKRLITFRMVQEILNNTIKHSKGNKVLINLNYMPKFMEIIISDNGIGFSKAELNDLKTKGTGLSNLFHRTNILGGSLNIISEKNQGVELKLVINRQDGNSGSD